MRNRLKPKNIFLKIVLIQNGFLDLLMTHHSKNLNTVLEGKGYSLKILIEKDLFFWNSLGFNPKDLRKIRLKCA